MQKNILLTIEYVGTRYFGFQIQNKSGKREIAVQQKLEQALKKLFKKRVALTSASRTDRGVHAQAQAANFIVDTKIPLSNIKRALNTFLPADIRVKSARFMPLDFHARFAAHSKIYRYIILNGKEPSVFWVDRAWHTVKPLNRRAMADVAKRLIGKHDFSLFAKEAHTYHDCAREVKGVRVIKRGSFLYVDIEANGFLRFMVRNIVGFLVKVGSGILSLEQAEAILARTVPYRNEPAPAGGLYLVKVNYRGYKG
ncbi:MAG: tRNA pseudouridine(38-40) synthase TruA [Candidatus Omnitrophota bacterium]